MAIPLERGSRAAEQIAFAKTLKGGERLSTPLGAGVVPRQEVPGQPLFIPGGVVTDTTSLIINLISGAVGGNAAAAAMPDKSLGTLGNSLAGLLGGGVGGSIIQALIPALAQGGGGDVGSILGNVAGGGSVARFSWALCR
jgi:uncharacterized membrane protein YeaQ/YmgE (transglycosylase-associated protein family)